MRKAALVAVCIIPLLLLPSRASAWGFTAHRLIMARALDLLPPELKPFYERYRDEIVARAIDPDLWRNVGFDEEEPNHFINFGARDYGEFPFVTLPREYGAALEKFGIATLRRNGLVPWRFQETFGNLRRAFEGYTRGSAYANSDVVLFSGVVGHYIQDAHQPLHATNNYDGQLTGNTGIHSRFERDLVERFQSRMTLKPKPPAAMTAPRDVAFEALLASYQLVPPILEADTAAIGSKDSYDDEYFEKFFGRVKSLLEQRLADAITATASAIVGAWEQAGKPVVKLEGARPVEKRRP
jgi:hypothetical protein